MGDWGKSVSSFVLGIISVSVVFAVAVPVIFGWKIGVLFTFIASGSVGVSGIVIAADARRETEYAIAAAGLILSIIGAALSAFGLFGCIIKI